MKIDSLIDVLTEEGSKFLTNQGHEAKQSKERMQKYLSAIRPTLEAELAKASAGSPIAAENLKFLQGQFLARSASEGIGIIQYERDAISAMVMTGFKILLSIAVAL